MNLEQDVVYIERVLAGDSSSFKFLVDKYKDKTFSLIVGIVKSNEDAEELAQDTFVKAFKNLKSFKKESKFSTWLYRIAYNTALTKVRTKKPEHQSIDVEHSNSLKDDANVFTEMLKEDRKKYLLLALKQLKEDERTMLHLYYSEEKDLPEIAEIIGTSHGSIRVKMLRTRNKLKDILDSMLRSKAEDIL